MQNVIRFIKLQPHHMPLVEGHRIVPELKLCGVWLEQQGFRAGDLAEVTICDGVLVIKPVVLE